MSAFSKSVMAHLQWSHPDLWDGIYTYSRQAKWLLMGTPTAISRPHTARNFDGLLIIASNLPDFDIRGSFPKASIVSLRDGINNFVADGMVTNDNDKIGRMAADYLHQSGATSFASLDAKRYRTGPSERARAFRQRLKELGIPPQRIKSLYCDGWRASSEENPTELITRISRWLSKEKLPISVFSPDGYLAYIFQQVLLGANFRVPEDVALLSSDNASICHAARIPISSIDVNLGRVGYEAAKQLDRLMNNKVVKERHILIPPLGIVERLSTCRLKSSDPLVESISSYIREHYMKRITAADILRNIHVSRSLAFARFKAEKGHTIGQEIEQIRLKHATTLLETTDYKIDVIARLSGYRSTSSFCRTFKKGLGMTPSQKRLHKQP